jgi:DNA-binding NtrC family response regulator
LAKHILSVSYDEPLLRTREILLRRQGYSVTSCLGFTAAREQCIANKFDFFILGHSIPQEDKLQLIHAFRTTSAGPVLALKRYGEAQLPHAEAQVYPDDIEGLLNTVESMLQGHNTAEQPGKKPARRMASGI